MNETGRFIPHLTTTDWAAEWVELQQARRAADDASHWDERSKTFGRPEKPTPYAVKFIEYAQIDPGDTVLDMGCGTGAIAFPVAQAGNRVIACDFSQGMIGVLRERCEEAGLSNVTTHVMSWEDDWDAFGLGENSVDVAVASRSAATADLGDALARLSRVARRRACVTMPTGCSPRADENILRAIGLGGMRGRDFLYTFMILAARGYCPEVRYIPSARLDTYESEEEAFGNLKKMVTHNFEDAVEAERIADALARLRAWIHDHLVENVAAGEPDASGLPQKRLRLDTPRIITWAHISWDTSR